MHSIYGRDLDLNLLRVFAVVAESRQRHRGGEPALPDPAGGQRGAAAADRPRSARRCSRAAAAGSRSPAAGERLRAGLQPHLQALVDAALAPATFDPRPASARCGSASPTRPSSGCLPPLLRVLGREAPRMRIVAVPVQFRTVAAALARRARRRDHRRRRAARDDPARALFYGGFICLFDPRHARLARR